MKIQKITNPHYLGLLAPKIERYAKKINIPGITYETLYTYFCNIAQMGGNQSEVVMAMDDNGKTVAFACWYVMPLPYTGTVHFDHIYSWDKTGEAVDLLTKEYVNFAKKNNCVYMGATLINTKIAERMKKLGKENGLNIEGAKSVNLIGRI